MYNKEKQIHVDCTGTDWAQGALRYQISLSFN